MPDAVAEFVKFGMTPDTLHLYKASLEALTKEEEEEPQEFVRVLVLSCFLSFTPHCVKWIN